MKRAPATAKLNLALVVGQRQEDGRHEVATVLQRLDLADRVAVEPAPRLRVEGFPEDTLVRGALESLGAAAGVEPGWEARIWKRIPVAAGLGGGSSDAATALRLANESLDEPLQAEALHELAARLGADVPFFLTSGPQLGEERLERLEALRAHHVEPAATLRADGDEPRVLEHVQVLGDRLLGDVEVLGDLVDRAWAVAHEQQHRPPPRLGQGREGRLRAHVADRIDKP